MVPDDDRGVSEVVGFILIFAILVISFTIYQGVLVPEQNKETEFDHNQEVQSQIQDLRNAILTTAGTGTGPSVSITLGASYPQRTFASNLGVSAGTITTTTRGNGIVITNVTALDSETSDYFGNSTVVLGPFRSKSIVYRPGYSFYSNAPESLYENTVAYNRFAGGQNLSITGQTVVDGRRILLVAINGSVSEASQSTVSLNPEAVSAPTSRVAISNESGPITLTLPTGLSAQNWTSILEEEYDPTGSDPNAYISNIKSSGQNEVKLVLEEGVTYNLRMARIGIGSGVEPVDPKYVTDIGGDDTSVVENGSKRLEVEVRDRFNNPISNATVSATITNGPGTLDGATDVVTNSRGRASFLYDAPENVDSTKPVDVEVSIDPNTNANHSVTFDLRVLNTDGSGTTEGNQTGTEDINPGGSGAITLEATSSLGTGGGQGNTSVFIDLNNNTGVSGNVEIVEARISFYLKGGNEPKPSYAYFDDAPDPTDADTNLTVSEDFVDVSPAIPLDTGTTRVHFEYDEKVEVEDFYVVSLRFRMPDGSIDTFTYFVSHPV